MKTPLNNGLIQIYFNCTMQSLKIHNKTVGELKSQPEHVSHNPLVPNLLTNTFLKPTLETMNVSLNIIKSTGPWKNSTND